MNETDEINQRKLKEQEIAAEANPISPVILGTDTTFEDPAHLTPEYQDYRLKWKEYPRDHFVGRFPLHLDIELSGLCNLTCTFCPRMKMDRSQGNMDFELFKKIIDEGAEKGLKAVNLNLLGESLLHPRIGDAIKYCKDKGILDVHMHTNATLLNEKKSRDLLESGLDAIKLSLDANEKETYEKLRVGGTFESVVQNIKNFVKMRDEMGLEKPKIKINLIEMKETTDQISDSIRFWKPIVNQIAILRYIYTGVGEDKSVYDRINKVKFSCPFLWQKLSVYWDGSIAFCFKSSYTKDYEIGNCNDQTIEEIWNSPGMNKIREIHKKGEYMTHNLCADCHVPQEEMSKHIAKEESFLKPEVRN